MFKRLFGGNPARQSGLALYNACAAHARTPDFYARWGVPDTVEGRFEIYALHVILVLARLKGQGEQASEVGQALFDSLLRGLDDGLREMGVGDLSVGKKMRKLGEALYGRARNATEALEGLPDRGALERFLKRTVYAQAPDADTSALTDWVIKAHSALADQDLSALLAGQASFAEVNG